MNIFAVTSQEVLERISRHCPEALSTYLQCINRADKDGEIYFSRHQIEVDLSEDWRPFQKNIKSLARENLLSWHPYNKGISITLMDIHEND